MDPQKKYIDPAVGDATYVCYNNNVYYLLMASGQNWNCEGNAPAYYCTTTLLEIPPGVDKLDGTNWGGVKKDDLVIG